MFPFLLFKTMFAQFTLAFFKAEKITPTQKHKTEAADINILSPGAMVEVSQ